LNYAGKFDAAVPHDGSAAPSHTYFHVDNPPAHAPADAIVVPDAHFLFNADFKRSGVDLILSGHDREVVLHDYFKGEKRAALASPDGAHLTGDIVNALTGHVDVAQAGTNPAAGQVIGHVTKLQGSATAIRNGVSIILNNGDNVEKGDVLQSGSNSTLGITFVDGTVFGLSSNARMVLNEMVYDPNGSNNSSLMSLVAGTISFVAGQTAKHGDMKIDTPVATMGIRGTAVLVQIDFTVPGQSGAPNASFQVLVEPDGTTGSYILFDKTTLQPIAMVNQAGQQININNGVISQSNAPLSPDVQKLIQDVFTQKFTDNSNTKQTSPFNDSVTPQQQQPFIKLADGATATPFVLIVNSSDPLPTASNGPAPSIVHIPGPPTTVVLDPLGQVTTAFSVAEVAGKTGFGQPDLISGRVNFVDINAGDQPTVKVAFNSFAYQNAKHLDVTGTLSTLQLADIAATEVKIDVVPDPNNKNTGSATWTYSIADKAFDFLAAGEQLTLTYLVRVDNNYASNNESTTVPITITITGTNDVPVITTSAQTIAFSGGTSTPGGAMVSSDPTSGTLLFQDADLTDTHTVSTPVLKGALLNGVELPQNERDLFAGALTASLRTDSTGTGNGIIDWKLADLPVYLADFIPKDETLVLTFTITVTDSQGAKAEQTVTVRITGTDNPAVVWIATTAPGSAAGGLWSEKANWETGAVPIATDDVIIITDQLRGLTPSFPVTVDIDAFAKSVTMNDYGHSPPKLFVLSTGSLTIGTGGLNMGADSVLHNAGIVTVAGKAEILDHSEILNSGTLDLAKGGDFADDSCITNTSTGTIEVSGGTLNVLVDIANAGKIAVDLGATLKLDGGAIDGGTVTIDGSLELEGLGILKNGTLGNYGKIDVRGSNAFDNEKVTNADAIEIFAAGALLIDLGSSVENQGGTITVDGTAALTIDHATITHGVVTNKSGGTINLNGAALLKDGSLGNSGDIKVIGSDNALDHETVTNTSTAAIDVTGILTLDLGTKIVGGHLNNSGTVHVETVAGATLDGVTVDNASGTIAVDTEDAPDPVPAKLTLDDGTTITSGKLTIGAAGTLEVLSEAGATLAGVTVDNSGIVQVDEGSALTLENTTIHGGKLTNDGIVHVETAVGATLDQVDVDNADGTIQIDDDKLPSPPPAKLTVKDGTKIVGGALTIGIAGTLEVSAYFGATLSGVDVGNSGDILVDEGSTLALCSTVITGGQLTDYGTIHVTGDSAIDTAAVTGGQLIVDYCKTLTLDGTSLIGTTVTDSGEIKIDAGKTLTLDSVTLTGGKIESLGTVEIAGNSSIKSDSFDNTHLTVDAAETLTIDGTKITGGDLAISGTLDTTGMDTISHASINIGKAGVVEATSGVLTIESYDTSTGITNHGTLEANGGELDIVGEAVTNAGTLQAIDHSTLELTSLTVTNDQGTVSTEFGSTLDLANAAIHGGTVSIDGTLDATGTSSIIDANISIGDLGVVESTKGVLTIDPPDATVGITNDGTLQANGGELDIVHEAVTNTGTLQAIDDSILKLVSLTVTNDDGDVSVEAQSTLDLIDAIIKGGTIDVAGTFDATGTSAIEYANINIASGGVLEVTGGTLTIDAASLIYNKGIVEVSGDGKLIIDGALSGNAEIVGHSILELGADSADAYEGAHIAFADGSTGTLKIDHAETFAGTVSGLDDNTLDLGDITFCPHMIVSFKGDSSGGILTIINPDDPTQVTQIHLVGDYLGSSWDLSSDGHGGTDVKETPGVLSGLDSHGNAVEGTTVKASVTDGGHEVTGATYTFETLNDDGTWKVVQNGKSDCYVPSEADEGRQLKVVVSYTDADNHAETSSISAGIVQEDPNENASITLSGLTKGNAVEGVKVIATVTDSDAPKSGIIYTWSVGDQVVKTGVDAYGSSYTPTEYDEGKAITVAVSFKDTHGFTEHGTASAGIVQDKPDSPPHIVGETDPATQTIILAESPIVLAAGTTTNLLGLQTETFDGVEPGLASNNGHGHGHFNSTALNAEFTASGNAGVVSGSSSVSAAPFIGPSPGHQDDSHYLSIGANGAETISFATEQNAFGLYWGSVDSYNKIDFYNGDKLVASYTGADVSPLLANGGQTAFSANGYVEFADLVPFNKVVLSSGSSNAFEIDNISAGYKSDHHIHLTEPITGTLTVSDNDIGDTLTASVTGPAVITYNGSSKLPAGVNVDALINPKAVTFDSVTSDGKADALHWNYNPTNPDLDFLEPGDTLTITFHAQVNDGHATAGNQALTITLTGTGSSVVNGTAQNDVFDHVGGGVTILGHGGNDTFSFNANFGSATIRDFNLDHDTINFDRAVFNSVQEFLDSAKSANFGLDTVITDANHDKIVLTGVHVEDLKAHPGDFHLV
jgi:fibronectin-binding autotransporter adhesin